MEGGYFCFREEEVEALGGWGFLRLHSCWGSLGSTPGLYNPPLLSSLSRTGACRKSERGPTQTLLSLAWPWEAGQLKEQRPRASGAGIAE